LIFKWLTIFIEDVVHYEGLTPDLQLKLSFFLTLEGWKCLNRPSILILVTTPNVGPPVLDLKEFFPLIFNGFCSTRWASRKTGTGQESGSIFTVLYPAVARQTRFE